MPRELSPRERQQVAEIVAELAANIDLRPATIAGQLDMRASKMAITHVNPLANWQAMVDAVYSGMSKEAGWGADAVAFMLHRLADELPGNAALRNLAFDIGARPGAAAGAAGAGGPAAPQGLTSLFLSYKSSERAEVDALYDELLRQKPGLKVFQDHRMPPGTVWLDAIERAAASSRLVCWATPTFLGAPFCAYEVGVATHARMAIIPVLIGSGANVPAYLSRYQGIVVTPPLDIADIAARILAAIG